MDLYWGRNSHEERHSRRALDPFKNHVPAGLSLTERGGDPLNPWKKKKGYYRASSLRDILLKRFPLEKPKERNHPQESHREHYCEEVNEKDPPVSNSKGNSQGKKRSSCTLSSGKEGR